MAISKAIEDELRDAWIRGTLSESPIDRLWRRAPSQPRIVALPNGAPVPATPWQRRPDWRAAPRAAFVGRLRRRRGSID